MPIYEHVCENCGHKLEALQKMTDKPLTKCPECNKDTLKRVMSASFFRLLGDGWYKPSSRPE